MRIHRAVVVCFMFLLSLIASAQTYSVRVAYNTNLRTSYSLEAGVVDTATAGTTLTVAGSQENWLKVDWNGRHLWMADWVPFDRVDGQQAPSDIDNCCFVDRQCNTEHEWTDGYWAYQNNQCGAPLTPVTVVSAPITTTSPGEADNCCQLGWDCRSDQEWHIGNLAYQANQCKHRGLEFEGPASFVKQVEDTLDFIQARSSHWYGYITGGLSKVRYDPNAQRSAVNVHSGTWHVPPSRVDSWGDMVAIVGGLAHEACHVHIYQSGQKPGELVGERACLEAQIAAVQAVYPSGRQSYLDWATNLLANIEKPEFQWWH